VILQSLRSFTLTANAAGLDIHDKVWTSQAAQFWLSENAKRGISHKAYRNKPEALRNRLYRTFSFLPQHLAAASAPVPPVPFPGFPSRKWDSVQPIKLVLVTCV
jgi:hypothetical protein